MHRTVSLAGRCPDCGSAVEVRHTQAFYGEKLSCSWAVHCPACMYRVTGDGPESPEEARRAFLDRDGEFALLRGPGAVAGVLARAMSHALGGSLSDALKAARSEGSLWSGTEPEVLAKRRALERDGAVGLEVLRVEK